MFAFETSSKEVFRRVPTFGQIKLIFDAEWTFRRLYLWGQLSLPSINLQREEGHDANYKFKKNLLSNGIHVSYLSSQCFY